MATQKDDTTVAVPKLLTPSKAAELLQVTERTLYNWLRKGALPALKIGGTWRIQATVVSDQVDKQTRERAEKAGMVQDH